VKNVWQFKEAEKQFGAIVDEALAHGPQTVTRGGKPVVQIVPVENGTAARQKPKKQKLSEFFGVLRGVDLDLERITDYPRDIDL